MNPNERTPDDKNPGGLNGNEPAPDETHGDDGLADSIRSIRGVGESRTGVDADDA